MNETFRYRSVLLPEYISTLGVSFLTTLIVMSDPKLSIPREAPHYPVALGLYCGLVLLLIWRTVQARWRWCAITIGDKALGGYPFGVEKFSLWLSSIESIEETVRKFYGRRARLLTIQASPHRRIEIADYIGNYERLKQLLTERTGCAIVPVGDTPEESERLRSRSQRRDEVFSRSGCVGALVNLLVRFVAFLPVLFVDLIFILLVILAFQGDYERGDPRTIYSGPISLAAAAVAARHFYYRLSSSIRLNRVIRCRFIRRRARGEG